MRKAAQSAVLVYWNSKLLAVNTPEDRSLQAKREGKDLRFVYKDPGARVSPFDSGGSGSYLTSVSSRADAEFSAPI